MKVRTAKGLDTQCLELVPECWGFFSGSWQSMRLKADLHLALGESSLYKNVPLVRWQRLQGLEEIKSQGDDRACEKRGRNAQHRKGVTKLRAHPHLAANTFPLQQPQRGTDGVVHIDSGKIFATQPEIGAEALQQRFEPIHLGDDVLQALLYDGLPRGLGFAD